MNQRKKCMIKQGQQIIISMKEWEEQEEWIIKISSVILQETQEVFKEDLEKEISNLTQVFLKISLACLLEEWVAEERIINHPL